MGRFIKDKECVKITGLSRTTRWRLINHGEFPKSCKLSERNRGWLEADIELWIKCRKNDESYSETIKNMAASLT